MASEADIIAATIARLVTAKVIGRRDIPDAVKATGVTSDEVREALRIHNVPRVALPSRLTLVELGEARSEFVQGTNTSVTKIGTKEFVAAHPLLPANAKTAPSPTEALAKLVDSLVTNDDGTPVPPPTQFAGHPSEEAEFADQKRRERSPQRSRPSTNINGKMWLRCSCGTDCGPKQTGWWPAEEFAPRADRPGRRRSTSNECYKAGLRKTRVTMKVTTALNAIGVVFTYDDAGYTESLSCRCCGEPIRNGDMVTSESAGVLHVGCAGK